MEEYAIKQKIQNAFSEPRAPEALIQSVTMRAQAITMGRNAQQQLAAAPGENVQALAAVAVVGKLAEMTPLPAQPQQLAGQLQQEPAFQAALAGGNLLQRIQSGELIRQIAQRNEVMEQAGPQAAATQKEMEVPIKEAPTLPGLG